MSENNKQQNITEFNFTAEQLVFAEEYIKAFGNISEASKVIENESRSLYYNWVKQEGFQEWLQEYAKSEVLKRRGKWYLIAERYAEAGSYQHLNMLMQIAKEFTPIIKGEGINIQNIIYNIQNTKGLSKDKQEVLDDRRQHINSGN